MSALENHIKNVHVKLQQLLKQYQSLQKDNNRLQQELAVLKDANTGHMQHISQLQEQVSILKSAAGSMDEEDKKLFEKNIRRYIKEIDKCIGLLSE